MSSIHLVMNKEGKWCSNDKKSMRKNLSKTHCLKNSKLSISFKKLKLIFTKLCKIKKISTPNSGKNKKEK